eukprot:3695244-Ditylum_brightwellii.AAC.1
MEVEGVLNVVEGSFDEDVVVLLADIGLVVVVVLVADVGIDVFVVGDQSIGWDELESAPVVALVVDV